MARFKNARDRQAFRSSQEEFARLRKMSNEVGVKFLFTDLRTALTFADMALQKDAQSRERHTQEARKAYETIMRYLPRVRMNRDETKEMEEGLSRLQGKLRAVGVLV